MKKAILLCIGCAICNVPLFSQSISQTLRGTIIERETGQPLEGVAVAVLKDSTMVESTLSDSAGRFRLPQVPVGRVTVTASYVGYKKVFIPNILHSSSKETVLNLEMENSVTDMAEVTVQGRRKGETINEMAVLSARAFTVEETERYAGSRGDPARMASNYAGVSGTDDSRNDLVIRGNSPFGIMYRLENVTIPNPNHFAVAGATGGSVGILNNRMLSNSDFLTGAFPAEFGNAIAGVFDIRMKSGNNQRHEYTLQVGMLGAEVFGEGPFKKDKSSYLFNYRYATLEGLVKLGIDIGTEAIPKYQDFQFKMSFPLKKGDNLSVFGIGGLSQINFITSDKKKPDENDIYATKDQDEYFRAGMGLLGFTYTHSEKGQDAYHKFSFAASTQYNKNNFFRVLRHVDSTTGNFVLDSTYAKLSYYFFNTRYTAAWTRNQKLSNRLSMRCGLSLEFLQPYFVDSILQEPPFNPQVTQWAWQQRLNTHSGLSVLLQPFMQWKYAVNEKLSLVAGVHGQYFTLNGSWALEPRVSMKWQFRQNQSLAFGTGLHSQLLPVYQYHIQDAYGKKYNKDLDLMRSFHVVAGYDVFFGKSVRLKAEAYFQQLWSLPVDTFASSYNMLNEGSGFDRFFPGKLQSSGQGRNMGVELTVEKFFTQGWFVLFSGSVFDSKLQGSDGRFYNSSFNGFYMLNALGTKEFKWENGRHREVKHKRVNTIGIGGKITFGGGQRYTPFDTTLSKLNEDPVVVDSLRNQYQFRPYFRFDIKINYRCNTRRATHEVGIDLVNLAFSKNVLRLQYVNPQTPPREVYQLGFLPLFYYRVDFGFGGGKKL